MKEKHNNSTYYWIFCLLVGLQHPATKTTTVSEIKAFFLMHQICGYFITLAPRGVIPTSCTNLTLLDISKRNLHPWGVKVSSGYSGLLLIRQFTPSSHSIVLFTQSFIIKIIILICPELLISFLPNQIFKQNSSHRNYMQFTQTSKSFVQDLSWN